MLRRHLTKICFILSLLLHLLFLLLYTPLGRIDLFPARAEDLEDGEIPEENRITFELVETPEDARSEEPPEETDLVSDKNSIARDLSTEKSPSSDEPYSEGDLDVKNVIIPSPEVPASESQIFSPEPAENNEASASEEAKESSESGMEEPQPEEQQTVSGVLPSQNLMRKESIPERPIYRNETSNAEEYGGLTFNTYDWDFAPYLLEMKRKIEKNMYPPPAFTRFGFIQGETIVRFKVLPSGVVTDMAVLDHTGHESLKTTSEQAILLSSAFARLPYDFPEEHLEVTCSFKYVILR